MSIKLRNKLIFIILLLLTACIKYYVPPEYSQQNNYLKKDLNIILRQEWGSEAAQHEAQKHDIKYITVHHGGVETADTIYAVRYIKNLQSWSRSEKNWIDIPYHFMMDYEGNIYEARPLEYPGDTNTSYDPDGHLLICLIGNYEIQKVKEIQLVKLAGFINYFSKKYNIDLTNVKTHKDYTETACPGKYLYKYFQDGTLFNNIHELNNQ